MPCIYLRRYSHSKTFPCYILLYSIQVLVWCAYARYEKYMSGASANTKLAPHSSLGVNNLRFSCCLLFYYIFVCVFFPFSDGAQTLSCNWRYSRCLGLVIFFIFCCCCRRRNMPSNGSIENHVECVWVYEFMC